MVEKENAEEVFDTSAEDAVNNAKLNVRPCATPDCGKAASMQCPTCLKLGLESTHFCSQECFVGFWKFHKLCHVKQNTPKDSGVYTGPLRPFPYSFTKHRSVPAHIQKPDYATTGQPNQHFQALADKSIPVYSDPEDIKNLRETCLIARKAMDVGHAAVAPGVTTEEIDRIVHDFIIDNGGYPSPLNYYGFPRSCCTSVNEIICHGIPDSRPLQEGDIINLDITVYKNGFHGDMNETFCVGQVAESSRALIETTYESLMKAIESCKPGAMYRECGNIITKHVEPKGYSVVTSYTGHGIGRIFHQAPQVPHYRNNKAKGFMKVGHVFTIEPMINQGTYKDFTWPDKWTSSTVDGQRSAQFEHTLLITEEGCEILTARLPTSPPLEHIVQKP